MIKTQHVCFILLICFILFLPGIAVSEENKSKPENTGSDKARIEKKLMNLSGFDLPRMGKKYSMNIIRPNPNIDPEIVKNTYDHSIDYKLRIINPCTKREVTGSKGLRFGLFRQKFQPKGNRYETQAGNSKKEVQDHK